MTVLAESAGKVQRQRDGDSGFYSILDGLKLHVNAVRWSEHKFRAAEIQQISDSRNSKTSNGIIYLGYLVYCL